MKINKKLSAAIVLSLMMGVYGNASAADLYGASESASNLVSDLKVTGYATTDDKEAIASGAAYTVISGPWEHVYGGYLYEGNEDNASVENNIVTINSSDSVGRYVCGGYIVTGKGNATGNTVIVENVNDSVNIYGGCIEEFAVGNANNNIVNVSGGKMSAVEGGCTLNGSAVGNHVNVTGGKMFWVIGGFSGLYGNATETLYASSNIVEISGAATEVANDVTGGAIQDGNAINNEAIVTGGTIGADVHGGEVACQGDAIGNKLTINGASATAKVQIGTIEGGKYKPDTGKVYGGKSADGAANNNKVGKIDSNGDLIGAATNFTAQVVYGGYGTTGATGNRVWLGEGAIASGVYGGDVDFSKGKGNANNNEVKIMNGASVTLGVTGGNATKGAATENTVVIDSSTVGSYVIGGMSDRYDATGNIVTIINSELGYQVYGGLATGNNANAKGNTVTISGDSTQIVSLIYGGQSEKGTAGGNGTKEGNIVTVSGGQFSRAIFGGASAYSDAINNTVNFEKGTINGDIYGGSGSDIDDNGGTKWIGSGNAIGNKVTISQAEGSTTQINGNVYGGYTIDGIVSKNTTTISGGVIAKDVYGGKTEKGNAENNVVTLNGGSILANGSANGGKSENGDATKNQVTVGATSVQTVNGGRADNGTASENVVTVEQWNHSGGNIRGGFGKIATQNEVYVKKGTVDAYVYGGLGGSEATKNYVKVETAVDSQNLFVYGGESSSGTVSQNVVDVYGKPNSVYGGYTTGSGAVSENVVNLYKDSNVNDVYGGKSDSGAVSGNIINVMGDVTVIYDVVGGESTSGAANDNIVNLGGYKDETGILYRELGAANVTGKLIGGIGTSRSGNTLNVYSLNNQVGGIEGFQKMNFFIPKDAAVGAILVQSTGDVDLSEAKDNIKAGFHNETSLTYGDKVKLIASNTKVSGMDGTSTLKVEETDFTDVDLLVYQGDDSMNQVSANATTLVAEIYNQELNENSKVLLETVMEEASLINDGSDMLAGAGLDSAQSAIAADLENGAPSGSMSIFGAVSGNKAKLKTGSHVDANGWNMNIGLAKELKNKDGKMILAPVVEYGRGEYDSYLDNGYHADGNAHFVGGGVMAKQINNNGNYFEGSVRAGKVSSEFKSTGGSYDSDAKYLAGHIGVGHIQKMDAKNSMDYYAKFFHTHISDDDVVVHAKGKDLALDLDSMNSSRLRLGGRLTHKMSNNNAYYFGLAYQREFNGNANGTLQDKDIVAPSMKGNTGFMELGVKLFDASKYDLDLGGFGSIGKKKGAGINLSFNYKF